MGVIPGVSAYHAAAAKLDMPLAETANTFAILPVAYSINTTVSIFRSSTP